MELELLVQRFQKKDLLAFEKLYEMYHDSICGVITTIVRDRELSEELAQDVFVKIWDKSGSYNPSKGRFFTWIVNIARNAAIDKVRSKSYKQQKQNLPADYFVGKLEHTDESPAEADMDTAGLKKVLLNLTKKCIQIIEMLYFKGFTQKETSEVLEIPLGTVKTRNRNCIAQIRQNIEL